MRFATCGLSVVLAAFPGLRLGAQEGDAEQERIVAKISELGGKVELDEQKPGKPVIKVNLSDTAAADKDLPQLQKLSQLRELNLSNTKLTNAGMKVVSRLTTLKQLGLDGTVITDAGLVQLTSLSQLEGLSLTKTKVTKNGIDKLLKAIPKLNVIFGF
jgi:hypothetical protein